jgi:hypothetical protein
MDANVNDIKFECRADPFGGQYCHLMGSAGVGLCQFQHDKVTRMV